MRSSDQDMKVPSGMEVVSAGESTILRIPWRIQLTLSAHVVFGLLCWMTVVALLQLEIPGFLIGACFVAVYVTLLTNVTVLTIRPDGVHVETGPVPMPYDPTLRLSADQLSTLKVKGEVMRWRAATGNMHDASTEQYTTHHSLYAGTTRVLRQYTDRSVIAFAARQIERVVQAPIAIVEEDDLTPRSAFERLTGSE